MGAASPLKEMVAVVEVDGAAADTVKRKGLVVEDRTVGSADTGLKLQGAGAVDKKLSGAHACEVSSISKLQGAGTHGCVARVGGGGVGDLEGEGASAALA